MTTPAQATAAPVQAPARRGGTPGFQRPAEVPWSSLGFEFLHSWAPAKNPFEGEHVEVSGQTGSGKSYMLATILHTRALERDSATIFVCTKKDDSTVLRLAALGWPICSKFEELRQYRQAIFWPQTDKMGAEREVFFEERIYELLVRLWVGQSNTITVFDEIGFVEELSARLKKMVRMYWREARTLGISIVASKQRPVGVLRDQHSETRWKAVFPPADFADMDRFAELLGRVQDWAPVLESLNQDLHQFVLRNSVTKDVYISWVDFALEKLPHLPKQRKSTQEQLYGRRAGEKVR